MEEVARASVAHFGAPVGSQKTLDSNVYRPPHLMTPKKGLSEADYSQWNMWADEKSRSNPASLLAPCTPELMVRVQSVLASPNSEDELSKNGYPIQQLMSFVLDAESQQDESSTSTSSSLFYSSDEEVSLIESPRHFQRAYAFSRQSSLCRSGSLFDRLEPQEPAVLPPQLAYGSEKLLKPVAGNVDTYESGRLRTHVRQYSDSSISDETTGYLSSSPSSSSSSSSSYVSSASSGSYFTSSYHSTPALEPAGANFSFGLYQVPLQPTSLPASHGYAHGMYPYGAPQPLMNNGGANVPFFPQMAPMPSVPLSHSSTPFFHNNMPYSHHSAPYQQMSQPHTGFGPVPNFAPSLLPPTTSTLLSHSRTKSTDSVPTYVPSRLAHLEATVPANCDSRSGSSSSLTAASNRSWEQVKSAKEYVPTMLSASVAAKVTNDVSKEILLSASSTPLYRSTSFIDARETIPHVEISKSGEVTNANTGKNKSIAVSLSNFVSLNSDAIQTIQQSVCNSLVDMPLEEVSIGSGNQSISVSKEVDDRIFANLKEIGDSKTFEEVQEWALTQVAKLSRSARWKFALDLADLAKRENCHESSSVYYQMSAQLNPTEAKCWLEWAKMEEESGNLDMCERILSEGLSHCFGGANSMFGVSGTCQAGSGGSALVPAFSSTSSSGNTLAHHSEFLVLRYLRVLMSRDKLQQARALLGKVLTNENASSGPSASSEVVIHDVKDWRMVLEGANLEWRAGRPQLAHAILKFLQSSMPSRTQPYVSRADLYKKEGKFKDALLCVLQGLAHLPNAGMLWFEALQLLQQLVALLPSTSSVITSNLTTTKDSNVVIAKTADKRVNGSGKSKNESSNAKGSPSAVGIACGTSSTVPSMSSPMCATSLPIMSTANVTSVGSSAAANLNALSDLSCFAEVPSSREVFFGDYFSRFVERALSSLSPELVWKFHLEVASFFEGVNDVKSARGALGLSAKACPSNLMWRVWVSGGRMELLMGGGEVRAARRLLVKAAKVVPKKMQSVVLLEISRVEEYLGRAEEARYVLTKAKRETKNEWKVYLELILLEMRQGDYEAAIRETRAALAIHPSAGRLWAILIQAHHFLHYHSSKCFEITKAILYEALNEVPKSGEVWCEGARIAMHAGLLNEARRYLGFAVELTSQYGDTTIEFIRLKLLEERAINGPQINCSTPQFLSVEFNKNDRLAQLCTYANPNYGPVWAYCQNFTHDPSISTMTSAHRHLLELAKTDPSMDLVHHLLGQRQTDPETRRKLIFS